jgi:hypothetical protein
MIGINGYVVPIVDAAGQLHLIVNMRPMATQKVGIYYSSWTGSDWSPVVPLAIDTPAANSAHYTAAVVAHGNEIHIVWNQISGGEIWHLRGVIQNVAPVQTSPAPTPMPAPTAVPAPTDVAVLPAQHIGAEVNPELPTVTGNSADSSPLIPAVIVTLVIIMAIAVARYAPRFRHTS